MRISSTALGAILAHAAGSRDEVCGLLLGGTGEIVEARRCANVHPAPATRFELDPAALLAAHRAARGGGPAVVGHYHSHPSGDALPSRADADAAPPDGAVWLIVADGGVRGWRAVADGAVHGRFDPVAIVD